MAPLVDPSQSSAIASPLDVYGRRIVAVLVAVALGFGVLVEFRSAFLRRHMTDLNVYLRAAWAVRIGADIYDVVDNNGWHYQYPPLLAILLTPLADPPPGANRSGMLPFGVSTALWYVFNVACLAGAIHLLAGVLERRWANARLAAPYWWEMRLVPLAVSIVPIGHTLMRGQVSLLLLFLLCAFVASLERTRRFCAGLWLAAAICLKVIPALLLVMPLGRRDVRGLAGCFAGLFLGLGLIPAAVFGWPRTLAYYREYDQKVLRPGLGDEQEKGRARELTDTVATDSQSLVAMFHNTLYLNRATRPRNASAVLRQWHWLAGGALLAATLLAGGRGLRATGCTDNVLLLGALIFNMLLLSPVCHLHYFCLLIPLVMGLLAAWLQASPPGPLLRLVPVWCGIHALTGLLPVIPGCEVVRDIGLATYGAAPLWLTGLALLWSPVHRRRVARPGSGAVALAA